MRKISIGCSIMGMDLPHRVFGNAGGTPASAKTVEGVRALSRVPDVQVITVGSATVLRRAGNGVDGAVVTYYDPRTGSSRNSVGLENGGIEFWDEALKEMVMYAHGAGKRIGFNGAPFNPMDSLRLARVGFRRGVDFFTLNAGCPNVKDGDEVHHILSNDEEGLEETLQLLTDEFGEKKNVAIKFSPILDPLDQKEVAELVNRFPIVKAVVTCNTIPDTLSFDDDGNPHIGFKQGLGGGGGEQLHGLALGQVRRFRNWLEPRIPIIGVGGVRNGRTARDFLLAGADAVKIGTASYFSEDPGIFGNVAAELIEEGLAIGLFDEKEVEALAMQAPQ